MTTGIPALLLLFLPLVLGAGDGVLRALRGRGPYPPTHTHTLSHHPRRHLSLRGNLLQLEPGHLDGVLMEVALTVGGGSECCIPGDGAGGWNSQFSE